ncbi:hypothetical protein Tel_01150 [Candidatus Tenderia electrophaga]|uniref:Zinc-finger domain-containing protein n=1 Tax=Candidatus Tenderia electrophaga TaxID=1748243 RepID=A0A0S2T9Q4_9GAMM|nr:hypothetical protein Tel_01150 [Candidatus Tenderia electrophaga]
MASQRLDRALALHQRLSLKMHLLMCKYCRNYAGQLAFLHRASPQLQAYIESRDDVSLTAEQKQRLRQALQQRH